MKILLILMLAVSLEASGQTTNVTETSGTVQNPLVIFTGTQAQISGTDGTSIPFSASGGTLHLPGGISISSGTNFGTLGVSGSGISAVATLNSIPFDVGVNPAAFGAIGDGSTDDTSALQNAEAYCATTGQPLCLQPGSTYLTKQPIVWQYTQNDIIGNGATISVEGTCGIIVSSTSSVVSAPVTNAPQHYMEGVELSGTIGLTGTTPPFPTGVVGIEMGMSSGTTSTASANAVIKNCVIRGVDIGIGWLGQGNSYLQRFQFDQVYACYYCLYSSGTTNFGENINFSQCAFFNSSDCLYATNGGDFSFSQCSFDYFTNCAVYCNAAASSFWHCHFETRYDGDSWIKCDQPNAFVAMNQCEYVPTATTGTISHYLMMTGTADTDSGIFVDEPNFSGIPPAYLYQTVTTGNVFVRSPINAYPFGALPWAASDNLLADGGFETTPSSLPEWVVTGQPPTLDHTTPAVSGTTSLKFAPTSGSASEIEFSTKVSPNSVPTLSYYIKNTGSNVNDAFTAYVNYTSPANSTYPVLSQNGIKYSGTTVCTNWTLQSFRPLVRPMSGGTLNVVFVMSSVSGTTSTNIDNVIIEAP